MICTLLLLALALPGPVAPIAPAEKGVSLGLFSADPNFDYRPLLEEVVATGATHVSIAWVWWQEDVRALMIEPRPGWSATPEQISRTMRAARGLGLHVTAFPILRLAKVGPKEWRGVIRPDDEDRWWESYQHFTLEAARLAVEGGAQRLSIGSELLSREGQRERWLALIERVRIAAAPLELMYSANWDHYQPVSFWDAVDVIGVTAYFELTKNLEADEAALAAAWGPVRAQLLDHATRVGKPLVISEIGYPSLDGGAVWPWDETRKAKVDLEEQRRAYAAFVTAWSRTPGLRGVYFWNWFGFGGPLDTNYTPRGKPAAEVLRAWYGGALTRPEDLRR
ncbi:MAG: hypothetical protein IPG45_07760 [Deltaproteobacteria bacterium]|nr:hypothetical protein [Deltaproteobacteria bacterium]